MKTHYDVLGVEPGADREVIRHAFLDLARSHHPDAGGDPAAMREVNDAWKVLGSARARRSYDIAIGLVSAADLRTGWRDGGFGYADAEAETATAWDLPEPVARSRSARAAWLDTVSLAVVIVLAAITALSLLFGMMIMSSGLLGFGVFVGFLTFIAILARMILALGRGT